MTVRIFIGDCRERMRELSDASVDSVVCDPPYHLTSIVKRFGSENAAPAKVGKTGAYARVSKGFMGQTWDGGDVAFQPETWAEVLRVLKPGGHLVAFSGTRTYHRLAVAIEDAGFEIRDQLAWVFASGFPKSHNLDKALGDENRCLCGAETLPERDLRLVRDTDLSEAVAVGEAGGEILFESLSKQGSSASGRAEPANHAGAEEPSLEGRGLPQESSRKLSGRQIRSRASMGQADGESGRLHHGASDGDGADVRLPTDALGSGEPQGSQPGEQSSVEPGTMADECGSQARGSWPICGGCSKPIVPTGYGSALKPAYEPICLARKPLQGTILRNFLTHGTGALNIDGCRIEAGNDDLNGGAYRGDGKPRDDGWGMQRTGSAGEFRKPEGRWPPNLCHDGSEEVLAGFPESDSTPFRANDVPTALHGGGIKSRSAGGFEDSGSAARFFYCAKATTDERGDGNNHPTVKPIALMQWLCRLVTPKGGTVLDPFAGSGSTLVAADMEQFNAIGCELSPEYAAIAERRVREAAGMFADVKVAA